jgi:hypothetical protein
VLRKLQLLRTLIDDNSQPSVVSTIEGCLLSPPKAACHFSSDISGSVFLTNSAHSIDFFDSLSENSRQKQSSSTLAAAGQIYDQSPFLMRADGSRVAL